MRGFVLTAQPQFLEPYGLGQAQARARLDAELNPELRPQLRGMEDAASAWQAWAATRVAPVQAAATASSQPLQVESSDPSQVKQWCLNASGRTLPAIQLDGMQVVGARMDRAASTDIVTVVYTAPTGARVTVGWLEGPGLSGSGVEDRNVSGHELLIVHSPVGTAVITGSSADAMWQTVAAIESAPA